MPLPDGRLSVLRPCKMHIRCQHLLNLGDDELAFSACDDMLYHLYHSKQLLLAKRILEVSRHQELMISIQADATRSY